MAPVVMFHSLSSRVELNSQVCSVPRAGSAGQDWSSGLQAVWEELETALAALKMEHRTVKVADA